VNEPRTALVHDWMVNEGGAEHVLLELSRLLGTADIFTSFHDPALMGWAFPRDRVRTWPLQPLTPLRRRFRSFLPLYPLWFGRLDLRAYDLVVSSSIAFTHAVRTRPGAMHVSYVYTPLRYAWDLDSYMERSSISLVSRVGARTIRPVLRRWDRETATRPDIVVAISNVVRERIRRHWGRDAEVIYPPVDVEHIPLSENDEGFLLVAARLLAYRRVDLAIRAAGVLGRRLVIAGDGPESRRLRSIAGPTVEFVGHVDRTKLLELFANCHAYLVPGVEDFGIAPVEAMAAGKPVVALRSGGAAETVLDGKTGVLFAEQDVESAVAAITRLDTIGFDPAACRSRAMEFDTAVFLRRWRELFARMGIESSLYEPHQGMASTAQ
jgi:glycosyltransferase involved in cell wall biosynthesis